ncbi:hypothetical protein CMV_018580 [Castanea mollissima]|uniref:BZIP domain-containing protein n=1 Tax=Castanea mollissima TaxID=60419 RepID=A0A8J4VNK9_9ROSI|nr:hypothetical protein CMV_018580 [Castanea mollissima]
MAKSRLEAHLLKGMEKSDGSPTMRNFTFKGRLLPLPPNTFDCIFPSDENCIANPTVRSVGYPKPMGGQCHQRTSSDSFLLEEQPSWLDELLNEPEIPVGRGHQRSSSDSIASLNGPAKSFREDRYKFKNNPEAGPSRGFSNFDHHKALYLQAMALVFKPQDHHALHKNLMACHLKPLADIKRAKQQFAQRSRLRKLQYIAEMERNIQVLQAEGYEVSAELEFLDQQNLILGLENMALKQRLESLSQERFIKHLEQDMLQKEVSRLQNLYQQQQQQQQMHSKRHQINSTNLDSRTSIIPKEAGS